MTSRLAGDVSMQDPVAYFLTWPTYGTWLPGDGRGWVELRSGWKLPSARLEQNCQSRMNEKQCLLSRVERQITITQIHETCDYRGWTLFAVDCRSNHAHVLVGASNTDPKKIRTDLKAWCTRRLKEKSDSNRNNWWAERGSIRWVWNQNSLATVIEYITQAQDRKEHDLM